VVATAADGVGLARMEFIVNNHIKIHPMALVRYDDLDEADDRERIDELTAATTTRPSTSSSAWPTGSPASPPPRGPSPVIVRMSDFKTNEYAGSARRQGVRARRGEPDARLARRQPLLPRGYRDGFGLECGALRRVRDEMGLTNVVVMIPFCRTLDEADRVLEAMAEHGLSGAATAWRST
jgi:pyruvate, water dikinase